MKELVPFLLDQAKARTLVLGGIDDQIGAGTYAQRELPNDLVAHLSGEEKPQCLSEIERYTWWRYSDGAPYSLKKNTFILKCLHSIQRTVSKIHFQTVSSLIRFFERDGQQFAKDPPNQTQASNARDHSMYLNFEWLVSRLPKGSKVIVWSATVHTAKSLPRRFPFGKYVRERFKDRSFSLGFSAYSGSYAMNHQPTQELSVAPIDSLEEQAFSNSADEVRYFGRDKLDRLGNISARPQGYAFTSAQWGEIVDGLVIFRQEEPPHFIDR